MSRIRTTRQAREIRIGVIAGMRQHELVINNSIPNWMKNFRSNQPEKILTWYFGDTLQWRAYVEYQDRAWTKYLRNMFGLRYVR